MLVITSSDILITNNQGVHDIRMTKAQQKISGCFRSKNGTHYFARIRAFIPTCKKHKVSQALALKELFERKFPDLMFFLFFWSLPVCAQATLVKPLQEILGTSSTQYFKLLDPEIIDVPAFDLDPQSKKKTVVTPDCFLLTTENGKVFSNRGHILINDSLVSELIWPWSELKKDSSSLILPEKEPKYLQGTAALITQEGCYNYYHWLTEVLPKLALLKIAEEKYGITYNTLLIPDSFDEYGFIDQTLELLGVKKKIIKFLPMDYLEVEHLFIPSLPSLSTYSPKWIINWLQENLASNIKPQRQKKNIFISRSKALSRHLTNEDILFDQLQPLGYEKIFLEDLNVEQQIELFKNSERIVGTHGAGFTNLIFCEPDTKVIEIFQKRKDETFSKLREILKINYHSVKTEEFANDGGFVDSTLSDEIIQLIVLLAK